MIVRIIALCVLYLLTCFLASCPQSDNTEDAVSEVSNLNVNPSPADSGDETSETPMSDTGETTESSGESSDSDTTESEPAPPAWVIDGIKPGDPIKFAADTENTIAFKFELPKDCHWNEDNPLGVNVTFAPDGIAVEPLEVEFKKPNDVPSELVFKVKGVKLGNSGELAFDVMAFFCSDEGFCMRKTDTVSFPFVAGEGKVPGKYNLIYKLTTD